MRLQGAHKRGANAEMRAKLKLFSLFTCFWDIDSSALRSYKYLVSIQYQVNTVQVFQTPILLTYKGSLCREEQRVMIHEKNHHQFAKF